MTLYIPQLWKRAEFQTHQMLQQCHYYGSTLLWCCQDSRLPVSTVDKGLWAHLPTLSPCHIHWYLICMLQIMYIFRDVTIFHQKNVYVLNILYHEYHDFKKEYILNLIKCTRNHLKCILFWGSQKVTKTVNYIIPWLMLCEN